MSSSASSTTGGSQGGSRRCVEVDSKFENVTFSLQMVYNGPNFSMLGVVAKLPSTTMIGERRKDYDQPTNYCNLITAGFSGLLDTLIPRLDTKASIDAETMRGNLSRLVTLLSKGARPKGSVRTEVDTEPDTSSVVSRLAYEASYRPMRGSQYRFADDERVKKQAESVFSKEGSIIWYCRDESAPGDLILVQSRPDGTRWAGLMRNVMTRGKEESPRKIFRVSSGELSKSPKAISELLSEYIKEHTRPTDIKGRDLAYLSGICESGSDREDDESKINSSITDSPVGPHQTRSSPAETTCITQDVMQRLIEEALARIQTETDL